MSTPGDTPAHEISLMCDDLDATTAELGAASHSVANLLAKAGVSPSQWCCPATPRCCCISLGTSLRSDRRPVEHDPPLVTQLPEAEHVDVEEWGDDPRFRVRGKNFVFANDVATNLSFILTKEEAIAVVATDNHASEAGYGLGRPGWIALDLPAGVSEARWDEVAEWIQTSYTLVAPKHEATR